MALTADKQQAWKARIESYLDKALVFVNAITNKHYEGDVTANKTLNILSVGDVSVSSYTGGWNDSDWNTLSTTGQTFAVDQLQKFIFRVLRTEQQGSALRLLDEGSKRAAYAVNNAIDQFVASLHSNITTNVYGDSTTPIVVGFDSSAGNVRPSVALATLTQKMAEANADQSDPRVVVPVWFASMLLAELSGRNTAKGDSVIQQGAVQGLLPGVAVSGFNQIWVSNNVANTAGEKYKVMAGSPNSSITFAMAIDEIDTVELQNDFATGVKGLQVFGGKIPFEAHMALGTFNQGSW